MDEDQNHEKEEKDQPPEVQNVDVEQQNGTKREDPASDIREVREMPCSNYNNQTNMYQHQYHNYHPHVHPHNYLSSHSAFIGPQTSYSITPVYENPPPQLSHVHPYTSVVHGGGGALSSYIPTSDFVTPSTSSSNSVTQPELVSPDTSIASVILKASLTENIN